MISTQQWRASISLSGIFPKLRKHKDSKIYQYHCSFAKNRGPCFWSATDGCNKCINLNDLTFVTKMMVFVFISMLVYSPYLSLNSNRKPIVMETNIHFSCSPAAILKPGHHCFPRFRNEISANLKQYFMLPHYAIEAQLVIGNIQRNPGPSTTSLKQFYKLIQPSFEKKVQGSFSQGDPKFGHSAGLQCVAMSLYAAAFSCLKQITRWSDKELDSILEKGNDLFNLINKDRYLGVDNLPGQVNIFDV